MTEQWRNAEKPTIVVTGSDGFLGSHLIDKLTKDYQVIGLDNKVTRSHPREAEQVFCDLLDKESISRAMERIAYAYGEKIASVIHFAAYYDFSGEPSPLYEEVTVKGTLRLLEALRGFAVEQFVFSSTMLVHEPTRLGVPITEDQPLLGKWDYPQSKIETEEVIRKNRGEIASVSLRIAGVYSDKCESIPIAHQIQRIYEERLTGHVFPGDTSHGQAFLHVDDLMASLKQTVERRLDLPEELSLLIGEPETYSYDSLQRELARLIHGEEDWVTEEIPKPVAKSGAWVQGKIPGIEEPFIKPWMIDLADDHYELNISNARKTIGWHPKRRLIETLPKMVATLKEDPEKWLSDHNLTQ